MAVVFQRLQLLCFPSAAMACLLAALAMKVVLWLRLAVALARPARPRVNTLHAVRARRQAVC
jgi:hypothetical protein